MSESQAGSVKRPLSPHLQVYKPQLTSVTSIFHRISGVVLSFGLLMFTWWLVAAAIGPDAYEAFMAFAGLGWVKLGLAGFTAAFYYHLANGIRHLVWDAGFLFKLKNAYVAGYVVLFSTVILTSLTWYCILTKTAS